MQSKPPRSMQPIIRCTMQYILQVNADHESPMIKLRTAYKSSAMIRATEYDVPRSP